MKKTIITLIAIAMLALACFVFNPSQQRHAEKIDTTLVAALKDVMTQKIGGPATSIIGLVVSDSKLNKIVDAVVMPHIEYHNYGVFSTCTWQDGDKQRVVSVGILGKVFCPSSGSIADSIIDRI